MKIEIEAKDISLSGIQLPFFFKLLDIFTGINWTWQASLSNKLRKSTRKKTQNSNYFNKYCTFKVETIPVFGIWMLNKGL